LLYQPVPYTRYSERTLFAITFVNVGSAHFFRLVLYQLVSDFLDYILYRIFLNIRYDFSVNSGSKTAFVFADISVRQHYVLFRDYHFHQVLEALSVFTVIVKFTQLFLQAVPVHILF
jgi:hypothetical protein